MTTRGATTEPLRVCWVDEDWDHTNASDRGRLVLKVVLATFLPTWLGSAWWSWTTYMGRDWSEPEDARHAALARLELRWPLPVATLPRPRPPARPGLPKLEGGEPR